MSYFFPKSKLMQLSNSVKEIWMQQLIEHLDKYFVSHYWIRHSSNSAFFYSITSSVGPTCSLHKLSGQWNFSRCFRTHGGLLHCRLRERIPPPHVLEHEPNFDQEPQLPSCPWGSWLDLQMQWPLKHHCSEGWQERKWHINESDMKPCQYI